jgi:hypothetical protein
MLTEIFYHIDNFCKEYEKHLEKIEINPGKKDSRGRKPSLCLSEIMTIVICFHFFNVLDLISQQEAQGGMLESYTFDENQS